VGNITGILGYTCTIWRWKIAISFCNTGISRYAHKYHLSRFGNV